jgi:hypothetical protein
LVVTGDRRKALKAAVDAATRERIAAARSIDPYSVPVTEEGIEETIDEETLARIVDVWRDQDWRLYTACSSCDRQAHCAGATRETVRCLACEIAGPNRRRTRMTTKTTETVSLRPALYEKLPESLGLTVTPAKSYDRLVLGTKTVAYVNGDRKLRLDVRIPEADVPAAVGEFAYGKYPGLASVSIAEPGDFPRAVAILKKAAAKIGAPAPEPEPAVEPATDAEVAAVVGADVAATLLGKAKDEVEVKPDPKPETGKKGGRKGSARKSPAKAGSSAA